MGRGTQSQAEHDKEIEERRKALLEQLSTADRDRYWRGGVLRYKLDSLQQKVYDWLEELDPELREAVLLIARKVGKTYLCVVIASEKAVAEKTQQIFVAESRKQVKEFLIPIFEEVYEDAPDDLRPEYKAHEGAYVFPHNGSRIVLAGAGNMAKANGLRGPFYHRVFIDEAGYNPVLRYLIKSVFLPTMNRIGRGLIISYSNAAMSPSHDVHVLAAEAETNGAYYHATVYDSPAFTEDDIERFARECGGYESSDFLREYMAKATNDEGQAVVPEWPSRARQPWVFDPLEARAKEVQPDTKPGDIKPPLIRQIRRPEFYDIYTIVDDGFDDLVSILAFYWHFDFQIMVVEGEAELHKPTTDLIADAVRTLEEETWGEYWDRCEGLGLSREPFKRRIDASKKSRKDLNRIYGFDFVQAEVGELPAQVKRLRKMVRFGEVVVNPACESLAAHLDSAYWNANRTKFARPSKKPRPGETRYFGHFDHVSSLQLGTGIVDREHDPYPLTHAHPISNRAPFRQPRPEVESPRVVDAAAQEQSLEERFGWLAESRPRMARRRR